MPRRREYFLRAINLNESEIAETEDPASNVTLQVNYKKQQAEFEKLSNKFEEIIMNKMKVEQENQLLKSKMLEFEKSMSELSSLKCEMEALKSNKVADPLPSTSKTPSKSVSFASSTVVGDVNPVMTVDGLLSKIYSAQSDSIKNESSNKTNESFASPPPVLNLSWYEDINVDELSRAEKITLSQVQAQLATSEAQREISATMNLEILRKALPKIAAFDGEPKKWIKFKQDVQRYRDVGKYPDDVMKLHVFQALQGIALARVQDLMDTTSFEVIMKILETSFGEPTRIIDRCGKDILSLKLNKELYKDDVMMINTKIQAYFSACRYANVPVANSNLLARHIFDQLSLQHKELFRRTNRLNNPNQCTRLLDLNALFNSLEELARDLEDKKCDEKKVDDRKIKNVQVNLSSMVPKQPQESQVRKPDDYMYELKDKSFSVNGYDLTLVNLLNKFCECCSRAGHFVVQCYKYREMEGPQRIKLVNDKNLCRNCLLTATHRASACSYKNGCGYKMSGDRCHYKHHITLHTAYQNSSNRNNNQNNRSNGNGNGGSNRNNRAFRRTNTNANQQRANQILNNSRGETSGISSNSSRSSEVVSDSVSSVIAQAPSIRQLSSRNAAMGNRVAPRQAAVNQTATGFVNNSDASADIVILPHDRPRQVLSVDSTNLQRTVKVFKNNFFGPNGYAIGHSIGDSAAEVTLVREDLRAKLGIEGDRCSLELQWTDGTTKSVDAVKIDLLVQGILCDSSPVLLRNCYAINDLRLACRSLDMNEMRRKFPYLTNVDFESYENISPLLLVGSPHASAIESIGKLIEEGEGKPVALKSKLGWTVYGGCPEILKHISCEVNIMQAHYVKSNDERMSNEELFEHYSFFNSVESLGIGGNSVHNTEDEKKALDMINEEMRQLSDGFIECPLIWNRVDGLLPSIPNNFRMVIKRQIAHEKKLSKNPQHYQAFNDNFMDLIREGYVRAATCDDLDGVWPNVSYLPMSLVVNANKDPPKFRTVFDASARYENTSLNDNLLKGPDMLVDLLKPLLCMRLSKIAFTADIKSMFMRIKINLRDQQVQRVLWRENSDEDFKIFVFTSMLFGPSSSPFVSQFVKNFTAEKWKNIYPKACETIVGRMYMDDLLTSENSVDDAVNIAKQCIEIFDSINWNLVSFQSNSLELLKALPHECVSQKCVALLEGVNEVCSTKVLGCEWDTKNDNFIYKFDKNLFIKIVKDCQHRPTKRDQCSTIARIFDVLGLICHFVIRGKILLQRSWLAGIDWDMETTDEIHQLWLSWLQDVEKIAMVKIPRLYNKVRSLPLCDAVELHTFCDAGGEAFATVSYIVSILNGVRHSNIVMAKAKVTPIRHKSRTQITEMPRLELCACLCGARLANTISKHYNGIKMKRFFWTDSVVVLGWFINPNHRLLKYAISPVEEILSKTQRAEWRYVPTKLNVADIPTKFTKFDFADSNSVWFRGPNFLRMDESQWPKMPDLLELPLAPKQECINMLNLNQVLFVSAHKLPPIDCPIMKDCCVDKLSPSITGTWSKLVRAIARGLKIWFDGVIPLLQSKQWNNIKLRNEMKIYHEGFRNLSANDLERAEHFLIRKAQRDSYQKEYEALRLNKPIDNKEFAQLNIFLDSQGIMRINSRVNLCSDIYPQKNAPLLPRKNAITRTFLFHVHNEYQHIHLESQIAAIRQKYWIPQLRQALNSVKHHCNFCALLRAKPYRPLMAPLPDFRTNPEQRPFEVTGLDAMGPFIVMNYTKTKKVWVLIFVCTLTRFIHMHIVDSLESIKVLEAIVEFWAAHGPVKTLISDRGSNFVGASRVIAEDFKNTFKCLSDSHKALSQQLAEKYQVTWKLLPAHSPWMGGFYERMIKEVKRSIAHVLNNKKITMCMLNIALQDAAHRINNRPLTHNAIEAEDAEILTPHLLAKGRSGWPYLPGLPPSRPTDITCDRSVYRQGRSVADEVMQRFYRNYLPILTKRTKWFKDDKPLQVGDLVLLIEPNETRKDWRRGLVVRLYKGSDGRSRVADVKMSDQTIKKSRSVQRLAKIVISRNEDAQ